MRLATYNIHRAVGMDRRQDTDRVLSVIRELDADVVALQEVEWRENAKGGESQIEAFQDLSGYRGFLGPNMRDHRGHYGNVLLTRWPVVAKRTFDLSQPGREPRGAVEITLSAPLGILRVIATHLGLGPGERRRQVRSLIQETGAEPRRPTILLGDFNDWTPGSLGLLPLLSSLTPSKAVASYPSRWPLFALDRILGRGVIFTQPPNAHRSRLARNASDHLPVVAEVELADS